MDALENLVAQQEIRDLSARYAMFLDDHDWDALARLWTEDAVWSIGDIIFDGRPAVMGFLRGCLTEDYFAKHINGQSLIEVNEDGISATGKTDVLWLAQNFETQVMARYVDSYVKVDGRWLFKHREEIAVAYRPGPVSSGPMAIGGPTMR
jgi:SnoaL-like protein